MRVAVRLFGPARDQADDDAVEIELESTSTTAGRLLAALCQQRPQLEALVQRSRLACNEEFCSDDTPITEDDRVALIPPVAGG